MLPSLPLDRKDYKRDDLARASVKLRAPQGQHGSPFAPKPLKRTAAQAGLIAGPLQGLFKEQRMSEIEAKLRKFYMPDITSICEQCNWELDACEEPELQDYSKDDAAGLVVWSKPGTGKLGCISQI